MILREAERERRSASISATQRGLVCATCEHAITDDGHRIEMAGSHEHTFVNPAGFSFHIGCFAAAPGAARIGRAESAFSWFPGWAWQIVVCARCATHLGWRYHNAGSELFGLILAALRRT